MKLGSLFDGSGTAPLAAAMCGIEPVWASEIEPYPIKVTKARFPNILHLGDITKINGAEVEPVDIICGGSPCQDLSVAGKQKGLQDGERSHLFFEMTRIIKQMREATNGKYPRYIIWENVPGAFSSNKGRDFHAVLQAFAEIADPDVYVPEPESKAGRLVWKYAGEIMGDGWSVAWRTVDAQYWGVPQRRRRIYLVTDLGGECTGEVLFERTGLSGDPKPSGTQRKETAGDAGSGVDGSSYTVYPLNEQIILRHNKLGRGTGFGAGEAGDPAYTLQANHPHMIAAGFVGRQGAKSGSVGFDVGVAPTLRQGITTDCVYWLQGNGIDRAETAGCNGKGWRENESYSLNTIDRPAVCFAADCRNGALNEELSGTLQAKPGGGYSLNYQNPVVYSSGSFGTLSEGVGCLGTGTRATAEMVAVFDARGNGNGDTAPTITGDHNRRTSDYTALAVGNGQLHQISMSEQSNCLDCMHDQQAVLTSGKPPRKYIVRRLTPLECCRLQGFPDWWEDGVEGSDSARYKMWGNGMALPNMLHVMRGIARVEAMGRGREEGAG